MSAEFNRVLTEWATKLLPDHIDARSVTRVEPQWEPGWGGSDVTAGEDPEFLIVVYYVTTSGDPERYILYGSDGNAVKMSALLRDLFALADPVR